MIIETLVATIDQTDRSLADKMNLQTDAIIGNQCGRKSRDEFYRDGKRIVYLNTAERGVGKNRNLLLRAASADICILADDDMKFVEGYPEIAGKAFLECPDADILVFNLLEKNPRRYVNKKITRVHFQNYAKYGAARIAFRRSALIAADIKFNLSFGGGAKYGSGEDTIFLWECLKKKLKIYAVPYALAWIDQEAASTWFTGYDEKYFRDKGVLYACLHPVLWPVYVLRFLILYRKKYLAALSFSKALRAMAAGAFSYRKEE